MRRWGAQRLNVWNGFSLTLYETDRFYSCVVPFAVVPSCRRDPLWHLMGEDQHGQPLDSQDRRFPLLVPGGPLCLCGCGVNAVYNWNDLIQLTWLFRDENYLLFTPTAASEASASEAMDTSVLVVSLRTTTSQVSSLPTSRRLDSCSQRLPSFLNDLANSAFSRLMAIILRERFSVALNKSSVNGILRIRQDFMGVRRID